MKRLRDSAIGLGMAVGAVVLLMVILLARRAFREAARAGAPIARTEPATYERCEELEKQYRAAWQTLNHCTRDEECAAAPRGELFTGLDDCARFGPRAADTKTADAVAATWLASGCAHAFALCQGKPESVCREGRCDERPPPPLPAAWRRFVQRNAFHFFMPPDLVEVPIAADEGGIYVWKSPRMQVSIDFSGWGSTLEGGDDVNPSMRSVSREKLQIDGQPALLRIFEMPPIPERKRYEPWTTVALHIPDVPSGPGQSGRALTMYAHCKGAPPCEEGNLIMRSLVLRWGTHP